jgi:hypothetical protein
MSACRLSTSKALDKAHQAAKDQPYVRDRRQGPIVFTTLVNMEILAVIKAHCNGMPLDMFGMFVAPLEMGELGLKSNHRVGDFQMLPKKQSL